MLIFIYLAKTAGQKSSPIITLGERSTCMNSLCSNCNSVTDIPTLYNVWISQLLEEWSQRCMLIDGTSELNFRFSLFVNCGL